MDVETITTNQLTVEKGHQRYEQYNTDDANRDNLITDWEGANVIDRESKRSVCWIQEALWIRLITPINYQAGYVPAQDIKQKAAILGDNSVPVVSLVK